MNESSSAGIPAKGVGSILPISSIVSDQRQRTAKRWWTIFAISAISLLIALGMTVRAIYTPVARGVLPGEFEPQEALLFSWTERSGEIITSAALSVHDRLDIVVLARQDQAHSVFQSLLDAGVPLERLLVIPTSVESMWVRDFGPLIIKSPEGGFRVVDTDYGIEGSDPNHTEVPAILAAELHLPLMKSSLMIENGNLLSNGAGICVTTKKTLKTNSNSAFVSRRAREYLGANEVVYLEPMVGELTEHVDMFATFTAPDTIIVGEYAVKYDAVNSAILDRNAKTLASLQTACGPLKVIRIPMPERQFGLWMTYTNVVYANGKLLFPIYSTWDADTREKARDVYRTLLPQWEIVEVDCSTSIRKGGAIHCMSMNLFRTPKATRQQTNWPLSARDAW